MPTQTDTPAEAIPAPISRTVTLQECLDLAFQNNHRRPASQFAVAAAEAQHRQALAAYWPQLTLQAGVKRLDEAPNFLFPSSTFAIPSQSVTTPASVAYVTVPAGVLGPTAVQLPVTVPSQTVTTQASSMTTPSQNIKLMGRDTASTELEAKWLLYDGGMRAGLSRQGAAQVDALRQAARRTDLEIADSVKRLYYGAVLASRLRRIGDDTLARLEATLTVTESLYKGGGGKVTKIDYLDNKVMVETVRALVASLEKNEAMARAALANTAGLPWNASLIPSETDIPFTPFKGSLEELVSQAYRFNPDWNSLEAGLRAAEGAVQTAKSGHHPRVALTGSLHRYWNDYDAGLATQENETGWSVGLGFEIPIFEGGLTRARIAEAKARQSQLKEQGFLLREGIGLQVRDCVLGLEESAKTCAAAETAVKAASENLELVLRSYRDEAVETERVLRTQMLEAFMQAQYLKARYDYLTLQSRINLIVGSEVSRQLQAAP